MNVASAIFNSGSTRSPSDNKDNSFPNTRAQMFLRGRNSQPGHRWLNYLRGEALRQGYGELLPCSDTHRAALMERHVRHSRGVGQQLVASNPSPWDKLPPALKSALLAIVSSHREVKGLSFETRQMSCWRC